ncbi:hypothetical protein GGR51DRAFT_552106 [Nemania sp. FL0031]|nr:hypothetical protein GGR51DRAFT_552106 [Nemania sp. FL0031]
MPSEMKRGAPPRESRRKRISTNTNTRPQQTISPLVPRRSERIRKQQLDKVSDPPVKRRPLAQPRRRQGNKNYDKSTPHLSQRDSRKKSFYSQLSSWVDRERIERARFLEAAGILEHDDSSIEAASVFSTPTQVTAQNPSTILALERNKVVAQQPTARNLEIRGVFTDAPLREQWTEIFETYLVEGKVKIPFKETRTLQKSVNNFLNKVQGAKDNDDSSDAIENLCNDINDWKATVRLAVITNRDFNHDLERCENPSNEAIFQRTVMMSIIDRSHLKTTFDFNCEGQWSLEGDNALPSAGGPMDVITAPKPNLAIFFRRQALGRDIWRASIPSDLESCMNPDKYRNRCFPFMFVETKKEFDSIESAVMANCLSASQALFNIYAWMKRADLEELFFNEVRVFTITISAEKVIFRVHRAVKSISWRGKLEIYYYYDDLKCGGYTRDELCTLIHNILNEYAETTLLEALKKTVNDVFIKELEDRQQNS